MSEGEHAPWYLRLGAWVGIGTGPGALATGGGIASFLAPRELLVAVPLGVAALGLLAGAQGVRGRRRRAPMVGLARITFGETRGPRAVAAMIVLGLAGWVGFYIGVASGAVSSLLGSPGWAGAVVLAVLLWAVHQAGRSIWDVSVALTGAAAVGVAVLVFLGVPGGAAPAVSEGFRLGPVLAGAGAIVAYAAVFSVRVADFTWDVRRDADVVRGASVMALTLLLFVGLGAGMYLRAGGWDLADLTNRTAYPAAAVLLLVVSAIAPTVSGLHSGGLALRLLTGWPVGRGAAVMAGVGGILGAGRFDLRLLPFLDVLGVVIPPVLATMLVHRPGQPSWQAWASWASGSGVALVAFLAGWPGPVAVGLGAAAAVMAGLAGTVSSGRAAPSVRGVSSVSEEGEL